MVDGERAFAANTAHELRTPLAAARAQAQRLVQASTDAATHGPALALLRQLDRLTHLATRLLQLARIESGVALNHEPVDLVQPALRVEDDGPGVPAERVPGLVQKFERGNGAHLAACSGLGLAMVETIARQSAARLLLRSPLADGRGFGASLRFDLGRGRRRPPRATDPPGLAPSCDAGASA